MNKDSLLSNWRNRISSKVLHAFDTIPREEFVLPELKQKAYDDTPLPILRNKTISQPSTVVLMTEALQVEPHHKILEIGTGSGYQAAIISHLIPDGKLVSTEVIPELVTFSKENLERVGIENVFVHEHDGSQGYNDDAPYDRIIFTAASPSVPLHLLSQLRLGGIMVVPVGDLRLQHMIKVTKYKDRVEQKNIGEFIFSPLVGKFGFDEEKVI